MGQRRNNFGNVKAFRTEWSWKFRYQILWNAAKDKAMLIEVIILNAYIKKDKGWT